MTRSVASLHSYPLNASRLHPSPDARIRTSGGDISPVSPELQRIFNVHRFANTIAQEKRDGENRVNLNRRFVAVLQNTSCGFRKQDRARILTDSPIYHSPDCANATNIHR